MWGNERLGRLERLGSGAGGGRAGGAGGWTATREADGGARRPCGREEELGCWPAREQHSLPLAASLHVVPSLRGAPGGRSSCRRQEEWLVEFSPSFTFEWLVDFSVSCYKGELLYCV
jgi:hypothetical protein